ncbi:hypothetical protein CALCODRAFT_521816 [Calocera cornea HHB12733]|uniref:Uncharacterized protein n=1 Tax=Calocera cornea HHB12733 TaxID=1353952 RepID=A0A165CFH5_9BASI|nr:hypothetical protein CALCODRAFT_521816 [Calocera cornea HHB12733]
MPTATWETGHRHGLRLGNPHPLEWKQSEETVMAEVIDRVLLEPVREREKLAREAREEREELEAAKKKKMVAKKKSKAKGKGKKGKGKQAAEDEDEDEDEEVEEEEREKNENGKRAADEEPSEFVPLHKRPRGNYEDYGIEHKTIHQEEQRYTFHYDEGPTIFKRAADNITTAAWSVEQVGNAVIEGASTVWDRSSMEERAELWRQLKQRYKAWFAGDELDECKFDAVANFKCGWARNRFDHTVFAQFYDERRPHRPYCEGVPQTGDSAIVWWVPLLRSTSLPYVLPEDRGEDVSTGEPIEREVDFTAERYKQLEQIHGGIPWTINALWARLLIQAHTAHFKAAYNALKLLPADHKLRIVYGDLEKSWAGDFAHERKDLFVPMPFSMLQAVWVRAQCKVRDLRGIFHAAVAAGSDPTFLSTHLPAVHNFIGVRLPDRPEQLDDALRQTLYKHGVPVLELKYRTEAVKQNPNALRKWEDINHTKLWVRIKRQAIHNDQVAAGGPTFQWEKNLLDPDAKTVEQARVASRASKEKRGEETAKYGKQLEKLEEKYELPTLEKEKEQRLLQFNLLKGKLRSRVIKLNFPGEKMAAGIVSTCYNGLQPRKGELPFNIDVEGKELELFLHPERLQSPTPTPRSPFFVPADTPAPPAFPSPSPALDIPSSPSSHSSTPSLTPTPSPRPPHHPRKLPTSNAAPRITISTTAAALKAKEKEKANAKGKPAHKTLETKASRMTAVRTPSPQPAPSCARKTLARKAPRMTVVRTPSPEPGPSRPRTTLATRAARMTVPQPPPVWPSGPPRLLPGSMAYPWGKRPSRPWDTPGPSK